MKHKTVRTVVLAGILAFCVLVCGLAVPTMAGDGDADKWEVTIHIKYNAVEWTKVEELVREMRAHAGACEAKLTVHKPDGGSNYITFDDVTGRVTLTPYGAIGTVD